MNLQVMIFTPNSQLQAWTAHHLFAVVYLLFRSFHTLLAFVTPVVFEIRSKPGLCC